MSESVLINERNRVLSGEGIMCCTGKVESACILRRSDVGCKTYEILVT